MTDSKGYLSPAALTALVVVFAISTIVLLAVALLRMPRTYNEQTALFTVGLGNPVENRLHDRFQDLDGDLLADAPADPDRWIDPAVLTFSYLSSEAENERFVSTWNAFVEYLSEQTGKPVDHVPFIDPDDQLRALKTGQLHVAGLNSGSVPIAVNDCGFIPVCTLGNEAGFGGYTMKIVAPASGPVKTLSDLRNRTLTLTDPSSNSGFRAPLVILMSDFGMRVERDYLIHMSFSHEASIRGAAEGTFEAAAVAGDLFDQAVAKGEIADDALHVVYESERFPTAALGVLYNLEPGLRAAVEQAFIEFAWGDAGLSEEFAVLDADRFVPVDYKNDWALIRRIDDLAGYRHVVPEEDAPEE